MKSRSVNFDNVKELAVDMWEDYVCTDSTVACIAYYDTIQELISELVMLSDGAFELTELDLNCGVEGEYLLSIYAGELNVEYLVFNNGYLLYDADYLYVDSTVSSKVLKRCCNSDAYVTDFEIGHRVIRDYEDEFDEDFCDGDCENCHIHDEDYYEDSEDLMDVEDGRVNVDFDEIDEMKGYTLTRTKDGAYEAYSFYSTDDDLVDNSLASIMASLRD